MTYLSPTSINMSKGFMEIMYYTNDITAGWFANLIVIAIYLIVLGIYYKSSDDFAGALAVAGFISFIFSLLGWMAGFISPITLGINLGLAIIGVLVLWVNPRNP